MCLRDPYNMLIIYLVITPRRRKPQTDTDIDFLFSYSRVPFVPRK